MIFGLLLARALGNTRFKWSGAKTTAVVLLIACLYGISDELHQYFVPGRVASLWDVIADSIGGFLGSFVFILRQKNSNSSYQK